MQVEAKIVVIGGPTASGKTAVGIRLAERFGGEIVSADSVQVYRYLDVGSAKPTVEEQSRVRHHMIDIRYPDEEFSAGDYVREARRAVDEILEKGGLPLVVGGTGLYIRLLLGGIVDLPGAAHVLRKKLLEEERTGGEGTLFGRLLDVDPETAGITGPHNIMRIVRALEVFEKTGKRLSEIQMEHAFADRPYRALFVCCAPERPALYERIDKRVDCMIKGGLFDEVRNLYERGYSRELKSLQSLGYRHAGLVLAGEKDRDEAIRLMKRDTRRYAKRQFTWFRSEPDVKWFDPAEAGNIELAVAHFLDR